MRAGSTFLLTGDDDHLWMIISDPEIDQQKLLLVNFTGWQLRHDQTCIVHPGDHSWLTKRSLVNYPAPRVMTAQDYCQREKYGLLSFRDDLSPELLKRIRMGGLITPYIPMEAGEILINHFPDLIEEIEGGAAVEDPGV